MHRRTKIVATMGPSTDDPKVLDKLIDAGLDVARINCSHGDPDEHSVRVARIRDRARAYGREVAILVDLQGPKIRIERFKNKRITLNEGEKFTLDAGLGVHDGDQSRVGIAYKELVHDVKRGDTLILDDGRIVLWVEAVSGTCIDCRVITGGPLSDKKGINRQGGGLSAPALTEKDREDIKMAAAIQADYVAISFPRTAADVEEARSLLRAAGGHGSLVAKIERAEALTCLEDIIAASDAVMIARGDLGVEIGDAELPAVQKHIVRVARDMNRIVITATQMMESMIENPIPTRAEVFDVANAVLDGTDAVMLSAETATGKHPAKAVAAMARICVEAEKQRSARVSDHRINTRFQRVDETIAMASMYTANHLGVSAIAALTESGSTPLWMSRISSSIPIYALTSHVETQRRVTLFRGVYPVAFEFPKHDHNGVIKKAVDELVRQGAAHDGDLVIITKGDEFGVMGGTNTMKIVRVGDPIDSPTL
ncbi:MAG: pyruvate kinase [Pseudomonadota bacterium]